MAVVAARWVVRPVCAAFAKPVRGAPTFEAKSSRAGFSSGNLSVQLRASARVVRSCAGDVNRARWGLGSKGQLRRVNVAKSRADDADDVDDDGVVKDMERYLNELSVEYENVWDTKPAWCQPWTIVLTGVTGMSLSWLVIKSTIVTGIVIVLVAAWWYLFLYTYPLAYSAMIEERRKKQRNGTEDTYGLRTRKE